MKNFKANNKFIAAVLFMLTFSLSTFSAHASLMLSFDLTSTNINLGDSFSVNLWHQPIVILPAKQLPAGDLI